MPPRLRSRIAQSETPTASSPAPVPEKLPRCTTSEYPQLVTLRREWRWAAFSTVFHTFDRLFQMEDVTISDIEDDLVRGTDFILSRIVHRLLYVLTQDRKITINNWQTALRKQYIRREPPHMNPIGPEPEEPDSDDEPSSPSSVRADLPEAVAKPDPDVAMDGPRNICMQPEVKVEVAETQETKDWLELPMLEKVKSLHMLVEWQFQNVNRLRSTMKDNDEDAEWRLQPIGYDFNNNAYWHIGDRLWIQRPLPKSSLKRKRPVPPPMRGTRPVAPPPRPKLTRNKRGRVQVSMSPSSSPPPRRARAAKVKANIKLETTVTSSGRTTRSKRHAAAPPMRTTRSSHRLATSEDSESDEWQSRTSDGEEDEESEGEKTSDADEDEDNEKAATKATSEKSSKKGVSTGLESDDGSELTELSDDEDASEPTRMESEEDITMSDAKPNTKLEPEAAFEPAPPPPPIRAPEDRGLEVPEELPDNFIEWQTICVSLYEWDHVADQWERSTHYDEKALYKVLTEDIVPEVTEELREQDRKRRIEDAVVGRKRSSRIAVIATAKEERESTAKHQAETQDKLGRSRRLEARMAKEKSERERQDRPVETPELPQEQPRQRYHQEIVLEPMPVLPRRGKQPQPMPPLPQRSPVRREVVQKELSSSVKPVHHRHMNGVGQPRDLYSVAPPAHSEYANGLASGSRTPEWELDCEVCRRHGINQDDGVPLMSCGVCSRWQHISCHDRADYQAGRLKRNWDVEEFVCQRCRPRVSVSSPYPQRSHSQSRPADYASRGPMPPVQIPRRSVNHSSSGREMYGQLPSPASSYSASRTSQDFGNSAVYPSVPNNFPPTQYGHERAQPVSAPTPHSYPAPMDGRSRNSGMSSSNGSFNAYPSPQHEFALQQPYSSNNGGRGQNPYPPQTGYTRISSSPVFPQHTGGIPNNRNSYQRQQQQLNHHSSRSYAAVPTRRPSMNPDIGWNTAGGNSVLPPFTSSFNSGLDLAPLDPGTFRSSPVDPRYNGGGEWSTQSATFPGLDSPDFTQYGGGSFTGSASYS